MSSQQHPDKFPTDGADDATAPQAPSPTSVIGEVKPGALNAEGLASAASVGDEVGEQRQLAPAKRIGVAKGQFVAPDEDAALDESVAKLFLKEGR